MFVIYILVCNLERNGVNAEKLVKIDHTQSFQKISFNFWGVHEDRILNSYYHHQRSKSSEYNLL